MLFEDPNVFTRPWTYKQPHIAAPKYVMYEYACHEGERDLQHFTDDTGAGQSEQFRTEDQKARVSAIVNGKIRARLPVKIQEMSVEDSQKSGAIGLFEHKYNDRVSVYFVGDYSKEVCGGPHVKNTSELAESGVFKIIKEEGVSAGVRRIKAMLEHF